MLSITEFEERGIILTEEDRQEICPAEPFNVIARKKPKNKCQICKSKTFTIFEYAGLDLCVTCCNQFIRQARDNELRKLDAPKPYSTLKQAEYFAVSDVIDRGMTITDSAAALGITRATMYAKLKEHGIERHGAGTTINDGQAGSPLCDVHQRREAG